MITAVNVALTVAACMATYLVLKVARSIAAVGKLPYFFQPIPAISRILMFNIVPTWMCPLQFKYLYNFKWNLFHQPRHSDVVACVSYNGIEYIVADADMAKEVTTTRREQFPKPTRFGSMQFGSSIITAEGKDWRRHRKIASAGFTERNNKLVVEETNKFCEGMVKELREKAAVGGADYAEINVTPYTLKMALSVICSTSFGMDCEWDKPQEVNGNNKMTFFEALETITTNPALSFVLPRWMLHFPLPQLQNMKQAKDTYFSSIRNKINSVKAMQLTETEKKGDLFSVLIRTSKDEPAEEGELVLTDDELCGNIFIFLLAGHETSAHTMAFALGLLALHQNVQADFYDEIKANCKEDYISYENASSNLKLGVAIMNETLRMFPIASGLSRTTQTATTLGEGDSKVSLPSKSLVLLNIQGIHYNEKYWGSDAATFRPHRFLEDYNKDAFIPFSDGPRACLGRRFAQLEIVTVLANLVRHFHITCDPQETVETLLKPEIILTLVPERPVLLKFTPRETMGGINN